MKSTVLAIAACLIFSLNAWGIEYVHPMTPLLSYEEVMALTPSARIQYVAEVRAALLDMENSVSSADPQYYAQSQSLFQQFQQMIAQIQLVDVAYATTLSCPRGSVTFGTLGCVRAVGKSAKVYKTNQACAADTDVAARVQNGSTTSVYCLTEFSRLSSSMQLKVMMSESKPIDRSTVLPPPPVVKKPVVTATVTPKAVAAQPPAAPVPLPVARPPAAAAPAPVVLPAIPATPPPATATPAAVAPPPAATAPPSAAATPPVAAASPAAPQPAAPPATANPPPKTRTPAQTPQQSTPPPPAPPPPFACTSKTQASMRSKFYQSLNGEQKSNQPNCIMGGNFSNYREFKVGRCNVVAKFPPDGKDGDASLDCGRKNICNPLLFCGTGDGKNFKPFCQSVNQSLTQDCATAAAHANIGACDPFQKLLQAGVSEDALKKAWDDLNNNYQNLCSKKGNFAEFFCNECNIMNKQIAHANDLAKQAFNDASAAACPEVPPATH